MAQARTERKAFDYATVIVDLAGHRFEANLANELYRAEDAHEHLRVVLDRMCGRPFRPSFVGTPVEVFDRLRKAAWHQDDVTTVITLGLLGAGREIEDAVATVDKHVRAHPLAQSLPAALAILGMFLVGADGGEADE